MAAVLPDDVNKIGEINRGGNVFTRIGAASVSMGYFNCFNYDVPIMQISGAYLIIKYISEIKFTECYMLLFAQCEKLNSYL